MCRYTVCDTFIYFVLLPGKLVPKCMSQKRPSKFRNSKNIFPGAGVKINIRLNKKRKESYNTFLQKSADGEELPDVCKPRQSLCLVLHSLITRRVWKSILSYTMVFAPEIIKELRTSLIIFCFVEYKRNTTKKHDMFSIMMCHHVFKFNLMGFFLFSTPKIKTQTSQVNADIPRCLGPRLSKLQPQNVHIFPHTTNGKDAAYYVTSKCTHLTYVISFNNKRFVYQDTRYLRLLSEVHGSRPL